MCFCSHVSMLRPVLPFNLTPRDDENVVAGAAAALESLPFLLLLLPPPVLLGLTLRCLPVLCCWNRACGEMLTETGPNTYEHKQLARARCNAAPARSDGDSGEDRLPSSPKFLPSSRLSCSSIVHSLLLLVCPWALFAEREFAGTGAACSVAACQSPTADSGR